MLRLWLVLNASRNQKPWTDRRKKNSQDEFVMFNSLVRDAANDRCTGYDYTVDVRANSHSFLERIKDSIILFLMFNKKKSLQ